MRPERFDLGRTGGAGQYGRVAGPHALAPTLIAARTSSVSIRTNSPGATPAALAAALGGTLHAVRPTTAERVVDVTHDSREARPGTAFVAVVGARADGHEHAAQAVADGSPLVIVERVLEDLAADQIVVADTRRALGDAAALVHGHPAEDLAVVGITGTNGKTTTAWLLEAAAAAAGLGTALFGTIATRVLGTEQPGVRTTPEASDLQRLLRSAHDRGADVVAMEVSSHGLVLERLRGMSFRVGVFTNLSQDHLDFHADMDDYFAAKARLFDPSWCGHAVVVVEDDWARRLLAEIDHAALPTTALVVSGADVPAGVERIEMSDVTATSTSTEVTLTGAPGHLLGPDGTRVVTTRLVGEFNAHNAAAAFVAAVHAGIDPDAALRGIAGCAGVPGRFEPVATQPGEPVVLVDYAHTPDAVVRAVEVLRPLVAPGGRLHVVLGAGGDRDRAKRAPMGAAAAGADHAVLTSDNPRSEDPAAIVAAVAAGARAAGTPAEVVVEVDRRRAIGIAIRAAGAGDVVLIAGKGHEQGQTFADRTVEFDDRLVAADVLAQLRGDA